MVFNLMTDRTDAAQYKLKNGNKVFTNWAQLFLMILKPQIEIGGRKEWTLRGT